jgi:hypothetical protein
MLLGNRARPTPSDSRLSTQSGILSFSQRYRPSPVTGIALHFYAFKTVPLAVTSFANVRKAFGSISWDHSNLLSVLSSLLQRLWALENRCAFRTLSLSRKRKKVWGCSKSVPLFRQATFQSPTTDVQVCWRAQISGRFLLIVSLTWRRIPMTICLLTVRPSGINSQRKRHPQRGLTLARPCLLGPQTRVPFFAAFLKHS